MKPSPEIVARAAEWAAELDSGALTDDTRAACDAWRRADPMHELALGRMLGLDARFERLDPAARAALRLAEARRGRSRAAAGAVLVLMVAVGAGWTASRTLAVRQMFPDHETVRGQQRTLSLADGSRLTLDTDSAVDVDGRTVTLFKGQVLATVAPDPSRPFVVRTVHGEATALGTVFVVRTGKEEAQVAVVESHVRACVKADCGDLGPGERARLGADGLSRLASTDARAAAAWTRGWLEVDDRPIAEVLSELGRYSEHPIDFDPAALRGVRVTGSYPLHDPERALEAIAAATGLRVSRSGAGDLRLVR